MITKRLFDFLVSLLGTVLVLPILIVLFILAGIDTASSGVFTQERIGQHASIFNILKIRSMHKQTGEISRFGRFLRKSKLDELPQLINVLIGDMSIVGPRPDIPGYYDRLEGEQRKILKLKPGLTSPAAIKFSDEEHILSDKETPLAYNDAVLFPEKVRMNLQYYYNRSFTGDLLIILKTMRTIVSHSSSDNYK